MRRESQNSSIPVPLFQSGGGLLNHPCGTYSRSGMIDYPTDVGIASGDGRTKKLKARLVTGGWRHVKRNDDVVCAIEAPGCLLFCLQDHRSSVWSSSVCVSGGQP